jgi:alpha-tubulin suppressor-like RCC1 family protein
MKQFILGVVFFTISIVNVSAAELYWVNGAGDWSDSTNHWSLTTGGTPGATIPKKGDSVYFDASSGLSSALDIVSVDTIILLDLIDFSGVANLFTMDAVVTDNHFVYGSIVGNGFGINFTGTWGEITMDAELPGQTISSGAIIWRQDFRVVGLEIAFSDDFNTDLRDLYVDSSGINANGFTFDLGSFYSTSTATRVLNFDNSTIVIADGVWQVDGTNLTSSFLNSEIQIGNTAGTASFIGGDQDYGILRSTTATTTEITNNNTFDLLEFSPSTILSIGNGDNLSTDSLIASGTCVSPFTIQSIAAGAASTITKTGAPIFNLANIIIDNVNALGGTTYNISSSEVLSGTGWTFVPSNFFWIGDGGNWNDVNQWSNTSGGAVSGCLPTIVDSVFFDNNSFSAANETVVVDDSAYCGYIDWSAVTNAQTMRIDSSLVIHGNIVLNGNLNVARGALSSAIILKDDVALTTNGAAIDCNVIVYMNDPTSVFLMNDDFVASESSGILFFNGVFNTSGYYLRMGSIFTADIPSALDQRTIYFGTSKIDLSKEFNANGDGGLTIIPGTSHLTIGSPLGLTNDLITTGKNFYDVTLNFTPNTNAQSVKGSNNFNKLIIPAGSSIYFEQGSTQTIADSLVAQGNCRDSIFLYTLDTVGLTPANFNKVGTDVLAECLNVSGITNTGIQLTALFSTDVTSNVNWDFNTAPSIATSFQPDSSLSSFCYGQLVYFENNSLPFDGTINDLTFEWSVGDGSLPIQEITSSVEANKMGEQINYSQTPGTSSDALNPITGWTETADPQGIFDPTTGLLSTTAGNENMSYSFTVGYRFSLVNSTGNDAYLVDMNSDPDTVAYNYLPRLKIFKNGAEFGVQSSQFAFPTHTFEEDTLPNGVTQIGLDTVSFTLVGQNLDLTDILSAQIGADVSYVSFTDEPRWKGGSLTTDGDVTVTYRIDIDTIYMLAIPTTPSYEIQELVHEFETGGDSIIVALNATDTRNFCEVTDTFYIDIFKPQSTFLASISDSIICPNTEVEFEAFSSVDTTQFEFFYNGVSQNTPSVNDTLFVVSPIMQDDTISVLAYENGCPSDTMPFYTYDVYDAPSFTWGNSSTGNEICQNDTVNFSATSPDSLNNFRFLVNNNSVSGILDSIANYSTPFLNNSDVVSLITIDTNACLDTSSVPFIVNALPNTLLGESSGGIVICENEMVTFTATNGDQFEFYINDTLVQGPLTANTWLVDSLTSSDNVSAIGVSADGCRNDAPSTYSYIVNTAPTVNLTSSDFDNTICTGESVTFTASGAGIYEFFIDGISVQGPSPVNTLISNTLANNEVISVQGKVSGCIGNEPSILMTVNTAPTTALTNDDSDNSICQGTTVVFSASGANTYEFFVAGVSQGAASASNTFTSNTIQNGQTIEVVGESNGCEVNALNTFIVLSKPNVGIVSDDANNSICNGDNISFTGANASNYEFFVNNTSVQGPITSSILSNPTLSLGNNTVLVIGTSNNGCTDTSQVISVQNNPIPNIVVNSSDADNTICAGESVTFTVTGGDNYQFVLNGTPQTSMTTTNTFTTTGLTNGQVLRVNGQLNGCSSVSNLITTVVNPSPSIALTSSDVDLIFCENVTVNFTANGATSYAFFVDGVSQGAPSATNTITSSGFAVGNYNVSVQGEASNCTSTSSINITVNGVPTVSLLSSDVDNSICDGETVVYNASGVSLYEFFINGVSQGAANPSNSIQFNNLIDNDVVSVIGSSNVGCKDTQVLPSIEVLPNPTVVLTSTDTDQQICTNEPVTFNASGASAYQFFVNGVAQGAPSATDNITINSLNNGDAVTVTGASNGCSSLSNNLEFQVFGFPIVNLTNNEDTVLCSDELTNLTSTGADEYLFSINGSPIGAFSPSNTFGSILNDGDIVAVEGRTNGCSSTSTSNITYAVFNYPAISAASSDADLEICLNDTIVFTSTGANSYAYSLNGLQIGSNTTGIFETDEISDADVFTVIGYNAHCASAASDFTFVVNEMNLSIATAPSNMICEGENLQVTVTGADEYEFFLNGNSTGTQSTNDTYSNSALTHHDQIAFVGYNNTTGCAQRYDDYIIVNVLDGPVITPLSNTSFCEGDTVVLVSNAPYGNAWYLNSNTVGVDTFYVADTSGSFTLEVTMGGMNDLWSMGQNAHGVFASGNSFNSSIPQASNSSIEFTEISAGYNFVAGIDGNKLLYTWGNNATGQLGNGTYTSSTSPIQVGSLADIKTVATGSNSVMATTELGGVYVWGNNVHGQLGTGNTSIVNFPLLNTNLVDIDTVAAGRTHYVLLKNDGTVQTVGNNDYGQLGNGTLTVSNSVITLPLSNIVTVGANEYASFAVENNGDMYVWGNNATGQLGLGDISNRLTPALSDLKGVTSVQGGANHTVFLTEENKVYATGGNAYGQLGISSQVNSLLPKKLDIQGVEMIAAGQYTTLLKRTDNSVFVSGNNTENQLSAIADTAISTLIHMAELEGVTFIESSQNASHFLYGQNVTCVSAPVVTSFLPSPEVQIIPTGDVLSTDQPTATSYQWFFNGNSIPGATSATFTANSSGNYKVEVFYANGCSSISGAYYHSLVGLPKDYAISLILYPNPANSVLNIEFNQAIGNVKITIVDNIGKIVKVIEENSNALSIPCQDLENGVYYLKVSSQYGNSIERFVVNH